MGMREKFDDKLNGTRIKDVEMKLTIKVTKLFLIETILGRGKLNVFSQFPKKITEFCVDGEGADKKIYSYRCYFQRRLYFIQKYLDVLTAYPYACIRLRYL